MYEILTLLLAIALWVFSYKKSIIKINCESASHLIQRSLKYLQIYTFTSYSDANFPIVQFHFQKKGKFDEIYENEIQLIYTVAINHFTLSPLEENFFQQFFQKKKNTTISELLQHPIFQSDIDNAKLLFDSVYQMREKFAKATYNDFLFQHPDQTSLAIAAKNAVLKLEPNPRETAKIFERNPEIPRDHLDQCMPLGSVTRSLKYIAACSRHDYKPSDIPKYFRTINHRYPKLFPFLYSWYKYYLPVWAKFKEEGL